MNQATDPSVVDSRWSSLYRVAGFAAILMVILVPIQIAVFVIWPPPATVTGWFALFQQNSLVGLLDLDLLLIVDQVLVALILVALYVALKQTNPSHMTIALTLGMMGIAAYFASTIAFEMFSLSRHHAAATSEAERSTLVAAGQVMLSTWQGTAFNVGYIMQGTGFLIIGFVMLQSAVFNKATATWGIALGVLSLIPPTVPVIGMIFAFGSLVPLVIWDIMVGRRFLKMAKG